MRPSPPFLHTAPFSVATAVVGEHAAYTVIDPGKSIGGKAFMEAEIALRHRDDVELFRQRHHTGVLTLFFADVVGSTNLKTKLGDLQGVALIQGFQALVRRIINPFADGEIISTSGDGVFAVFVKPSDGVRFALLLQHHLRGLGAAPDESLRARMGLHLGEVVIEQLEGAKRDLYGIQVDLAARVMSMAGADQILVTRAVFDNARYALSGREFSQLGSLTWLNHGAYQLRGIADPLEICEVGESDRALLHAPKDTPKTNREPTGGELVLGWRPAVDQTVPHTPWILERRLGEGGFGEVWLALHALMRERRVFKFCFRADRVRSLKRELVLFRLLGERVRDHPHIASLREVNLETPPYYLQMEYVAGEDLLNWFHRRQTAGPISMAMKLELIAQAADGLQAAHEAGVIHCDIKPANLLVCERSRTVTPAHQEASNKDPCNSNLIPSNPEVDSLLVKLTDFGVGQVMASEARVALTRSGITLPFADEDLSPFGGTQMYLAPELIAGKAASPRSDIFSLGIVLFQLVIEDFRQPLTIDWRKWIPDEFLQEDLARCFSGEPQERFGSASELARQLRTLETRRRGAAERRAAAVAREKAAFRRGLLRGAGILVPLLALWLWRWQLDAPPRISLPHHQESAANGYHFFQAAGESLQGKREIAELRAHLDPPATERLIQSNQLALQTIELGLRYPVRRPSRRLGTNSPDIGSLKQLADLVLLKGEASARQGDWSGAASAYLQNLRFCEEVKRGAPLVHAMVGMAIEAAALKHLAGLVEHLSVADLRHTIHVLEEISDHSVSYADVLKEEKWDVLGMALEEFDRGDWRGRFVQANQPDAFLEAIEAAWGITNESAPKNLFDQIYAHPTDERMAKLRQSSFLTWRVYTVSKRRLVRSYSQYMDDWITFAGQLGSAPQPPPPDFAAELLGARQVILDQTWFNLQRCRTHRELLTATLGITTFFRDNGRYPKNLEELVPHCLREVPKDPFAEDTPLRYHADPQAMRVYSVGPDRRDDGGLVQDDTTFPPRSRNYRGDVRLAIYPQSPN